MLSVKHVYKQSKKNREKQKLNNYKSKNQVTWDNEQHLESISNHFTQSQFCTHSVGFPISSMKGPFSHRGATSNHMTLGTPAIFNMTLNDNERSKETSKDSMDLRKIESGTSFIPVSAPAAAGIRGHGSHTQRNADQSKINKILIDDANGYPCNSIDLGEDSIVFAPPEGRNLYS
jgi:hypothetical protein